MFQSYVGYWNCIYFCLFILPTFFLLFRLRPKSLKGTPWWNRGCAHTTCYRLLLNGSRPPLSCLAVESWSYCQSRFSFVKRFTAWSFYIKTTFRGFQHSFKIAFFHGSSWWLHGSVLSLENQSLLLMAKRASL